ncbi:MAG: hypothetical protein M1834_003227 [Cirrosporium novae-zelandiae]|nr:MAG: hypothetical protein M1834_003227 [Cirrosporium novae-zelandiae]
MDLFGRRRLAIFGVLGMCIPHVIMAGIVGKYQGSWSSHMGVGWFGVALVYLYMMMYGLSYGPVWVTVPSEIFSSARRAKGVGLAGAINWLANFIIGIAVPPMIESIGYGTYIFFASFCLLAAVFSYFLVPELEGKTLEQIDDIFKDNLGAEEREIKKEILSGLKV